MEGFPQGHREGAEGLMITLMDELRASMRMSFCLTKPTSMAVLKGVTDYSPENLPSKSVQTEQFLLALVKARAERWLSGQALATLDVNTHLERAADATLIELSAEIWAHEENVAFEFEEIRPASWWEHLKQRHFPRWAERRWPVRYRRSKRVVSVNLQGLFPEAPREAGPCCIKVIR